MFFRLFSLAPTTFKKPFGFLRVFGTGILTFIYGLRLFNLAKKKVTNKEKTEYWGARELFLNLGRVSGYILLLLVGLNGINYLIYLLI